MHGANKLSLHPLPLISCVLFLCTSLPLSPSFLLPVCLRTRFYWSWKCVTVINFDSSPCRLALRWEERIMQPIHEAEDHASKAQTILHAWVPTLHAVQPYCRTRTLPSPQLGLRVDGYCLVKIWQICFTVLHLTSLICWILKDMRIRISSKKLHVSNTFIEMDFEIEYLIMHAHLTLI